MLVSTFNIHLPPYHRLIKGSTCAGEHIIKLHHVRLSPQLPQTAVPSAASSAVSSAASSAVSSAVSSAASSAASSKTYKPSSRTYKPSSRAPKPSMTVPHSCSAHRPLSSATSPLEQRLQIYQKRKYILLIQLKGCVDIICPLNTYQTV